ncbi:MAG: hypothetical protein PHP70_04645 [Gallionella sp.]|nr:hypothetical protein [Gallionella sp.]
MKINVATPGCLSSLKTMEGNWIYADDDLEIFRQTRDTLTKSTPLLSAEAFQQAALDLQASFVGWVDECMSTTPRSYWLATPLSKNPFESHLFLHLIWMVVIDQAIKEEKCNNMIIVTSSHGLSLALAELCLIRGCEYKHCGKISSFLRQCRHNLTALAKWLGKLLLLSCRVVIAKLIFTNKFVKDRLANLELLLETYIHDGDINSDGSCKDRYFPGLMAYYQSQGIKAGYFPLLHHTPLMHLWKTYSAMKRSQTPFVPFEAFVSFGDIMHAALVSLRHALTYRLQRPLAFQGIPVNYLVRAECFIAGLRSVIPFALKSAPRHMADAGIKPKWFIDWFENQTLDKAIVLGFKESQPECRIIAVRQYGFLTNIPYLFSSSGEVAAGVVPEENWLCGDAQKPMMSRFDSMGNYSVVPALRYAYLHQSAPAIEQGNALLVLLTYSDEESMGILDCVTPLCHGEELGISRIIVKTHPDINLTQFRQKAEQRFPALKTNIVEWTNRKLNETLPAAKAVVTSGSSSAVEAVCRGIPVVLIGRQAGLNFNPLEGVDIKMWGFAYNSADIREALTERFNEKQLPKSERFAIADVTRGAFFMEARADKMRRFLPTEQR